MTKLNKLGSDAQDFFEAFTGVTPEAANDDDAADDVARDAKADAPAEHGKRAGGAAVKSQS